MGGAESDIQSQSQHSNLSQRQLLDQNYSNNIMFLSLSTI